MADDDFADSFDDFPEDFGDEDLAAPPVKAPARKQQASAPQPQRRPQPQQQRNVVQTQAPASAPVHTPDKVRYVPFVLPARNGIFDNQTGQPFIEDQDKLDLLIGIQTDILNRLDRIEQGL